MTPTDSRAYGARTYRLSCRVTDKHLTLTGGVLKHRHPRCRWPQDNQLAVHGWITAEDEIDRTRFDSSGGVQHDPADGSLGASHLGKSALQAERRACSSAGMIRTVEEKQKGVTAPLQQVTAVVLGAHQEPPEHGVEEVAQLLRTFPAFASKPFSERSETRDVEKDKAAVDNSVGGLRIGGCPWGQQPWHVGHRGRALRERRQPGFPGAHRLTLTSVSDS